MFIRGNSGVTWEGHSVLAQDLTEWLVGISLSASSWSCEVKIEEVKSVNILWSELWAIDVVWSEHTCSLVDSSNVG